MEFGCSHGECEVEKDNDTYETCKEYDVTMCCIWIKAQVIDGSPLNKEFE